MSSTTASPSVEEDEKKKNQNSQTRNDTFYDSQGENCREMFPALKNAK